MQKIWISSLQDENHILRNVCMKLKTCMKIRMETDAKFDKTVMKRNNESITR